MILSVVIRLSGSFLRYILQVQPNFDPRILECYK